MVNTSGYYSYPIIFNDNIIFVSEGDLWTVSINSLTARRLTCNRGIIKTPIFSPDGKQVAFSCSTEGKSDLYVMNAHGGEMQRLTYMGHDINVICWNNDAIYFTSAYNQPFAKLNNIWKIEYPALEPKQINIGPANFISFSGNKEESVIQRHGYKEYGYWKRYRGGTAGEIWISNNKQKEFTKLINLKADFARPMWIKDKIIFSSDHDGIGNLYSVDTKGKNLIQLTTHKEYYVRNQHTDGKNIVYQSGGDIWLTDIATNNNYKLEINYCSDRSGRLRKFFNVEEYLQGYDLHPTGKHLSIISRGKACIMSNWEGAVKQIGNKDNIRYRLPQWLNDGKKILLISDDFNEDSIEIYDCENTQLLSKSKNINIGRVTNIWVNPKYNSIILFNHKHEVLYITLDNWEMQKIDHSPYNMPAGGSWSPDGKWFTYSTSSTSNRKQMAVRLFNTDTGKIEQISKPILVDESPIFDPEGKFIYFISHRTFDSVHDNIMFEYGFGASAKIYAIALQENTCSPFLKQPHSMEVKFNDEQDDKTKDKAKKDDAIKIDIKNIHNRIFEFPIEAGEYYNLIASKGKLFFISKLPEIADDESCGEPESLNLSLECFDFDSYKIESLGSGVHDIQLSNDEETLLVRTGHKLRAIKTGEKLNSDIGFNPKTGCINLNRAKLMVNPTDEWNQMYKEAWKLQRDHYWVEDMSSIDWKIVFDRYYKLLDRVSTREEFSDLVWEMQGELGTSHSYVMGGDVKKSIGWSVGSLGADFTWDETKNAYKINNIVQGDIWDITSSSALTNSGMTVKNGDYILSINQQKLNKDVTPNKLLFNQQNAIIELEISDKNLKNKRKFLTKVSTNLCKARYRDWVETNRAYIEKKTNGKVGYIHIPNMGTSGFAEFHRYFLQELDKDGLIIDVRYNGGGHISQLLLSKLMRKRLGYDQTRWHGTMPYFDESPVGPMVTLTNEYAGSDGDIFSHAFKMLNLGTLIGKRTWGGVIGIWPRYGLVDGGLTTQPEFSFWFQDVHWDVENYGTDPDIEVEMTPQDYMNNTDTQIDVGLKELEKIITKHNQAKEPDMKTRPNLKLPFTK